MLPNSLPSPLYTAVRVRTPSRGANSARPATPLYTGDVPSSVVPSKKLTVPVGAPEPGAGTDTVAVSVTGAPSTAGLGLAARTVRVGASASSTETVLAL